MKLVMEETLVTPRRSKRHPSEARIVDAHRRKSLFGLCDASPLSSPESIAKSPTSEQRLVSPSWSEESPAKLSPSKTPVKSLQNDFTAMALTRTPENNRIGIIRSARSPRILGVRRLSPDRGVISPKTFYGRSSIGSKSDSKTLFRQVRESVKMRLPMETLPREKKRARSSDTSSKRPKKIPRYRLFDDDPPKKRSLDKSLGVVEKKRKLEKKDRPTYNWQFFNKTPPSTTTSSLFKDRTSSVLTPPLTARKRKLISLYDLDHLTTTAEDNNTSVEPEGATVPDENDLGGQIARDFSDFEDDEDLEKEEKSVCQIITDLKKDITDILGKDNLQDEIRPLDEISPVKSKKYFSIFNPKTDENSPRNGYINRSPVTYDEPELKRAKTGMDQLILDVGQKALKEVVCSECGLLYVRGDDQDEEFHAKHHSKTTALIFKGLKTSRTVRVCGTDVVILVKMGDPKKSWEKAREVLDLVDSELGFPQGCSSPSQVYMYIKITKKEKRIVGCLAARPLSDAHRVIPCPDIDADLCTEETYPVRAGISRLWVHSKHRREGIASVLVDTLRRNYTYGEILKLDDIAFSSPTEDGKRFAAKYSQRDDFLIFTFEV